jgi:hypothetical protein
MIDTLIKLGFHRVNDESNNLWEKWEDIPNSNECLVNRIFIVPENYPNWRFTFRKTHETANESIILVYKEFTTEAHLISYLHKENHDK